MFLNHGICVKFFLLIHLQSILGILSTMALDPSTTVAPVAISTAIVTTTRTAVTLTPTKTIIAPLKQVTQIPRLKSQLLPKPEAVVATPRPPHEIDLISLSNISMHPYFDFDVPRNVTARVGQTAFLHCRVEQLGDKSVSWIRKRDLHILTAGVLTYTSDERFQVIRPDKSENWTLQIKFAQLRDSGIYECQVNTEPKMSMAFRLNVVEAKAKINGPTDLYVKMGSIVTLTCQISQGPHDLGTIIWYLGSSIIEPIEMHPNDPSLAYPPRIAVDVEWTEGLTSRLKISNARLTDSGNYSCVPTAAESSSVIVHVINGEHPAAMQRGSASRINTIQLVDYKNYNVKLLLILSLTFLLHHIVFMLFVSTSKLTTRNTKSPSFEQLCLSPTISIAKQITKKNKYLTKMCACSYCDCRYFVKKTITDDTKEIFLSKKTTNSSIAASAAAENLQTIVAPAALLSSENIIKKPMTPPQLATFEKIDYDLVTAMENVYIKWIICENSDIRIEPTNRIIITTKTLNSR